MTEEYVTRYVIKNGKVSNLKTKKEEAFKDVEFILKRDKEFLEIMKRL